MNVDVDLTSEPIPEEIQPPAAAGAGAWLEFRGVVRPEEKDEQISALVYEAYPEMAMREIRRLLGAIASRQPCLAAKVIHRIGTIPVGETAIYVGIASSHRAEGMALLAEFMDRLKQDVPIWKCRALLKAGKDHSPPSPHPGPLPSHRMGAERGNEPSVGRSSNGLQTPRTGPPKAVTLDDAIAKISFYCRPLPAVAVPLEESFGHILRETVCAPSDFPDCDRSTRDGYAILEDDDSGDYRVVDTLHAADWKPRQLKRGEAVRVATGASMPCSNLKVVMQEDVARDGERIRITKADPDLNIRRRGEEIKAGATLVPAGESLDAGKLALLASAGCVCPVVNPRLRVLHFTTGDEIVAPAMTPKPGQIRDSNSILIRGLLQRFHCDLIHHHLREDFELAMAQINDQAEAMERADVVLISGGASVGDKDFTRPLMEALGFDIVFSKVMIRPGRPTIFGVNGSRIVFGLPGNPLAHFVCFHLFVAPALTKLSGGKAAGFSRATLAAPLVDALNARETLWPARREWDGGQTLLRPLAWSSSGDVTCLVEANALLRVPANCAALESGMEVDFLAT